MITSNSNPHVRRIRSLATSSKDRRRERSFVLEGVRLVGEALAAGAALRLVLYAPEQLESTAEGAALADRLTNMSGCFATTPRVAAAAADTQHPQGVVAVCDWPDLERRSGLTLVLDAVQDPGNVGTLLRSAEAAGVGVVLCARGCADVYNPKVVRAAMGAHFYLPLRTELTWEEIDSELAGVPQCYAAEAGATMPYHAADWRQPAALLIGNEAHGLSDELRARATSLIGIPMAGRAESLNAGVAGSVILFEALRQRTRGRS